MDFLPVDKNDRLSLTYLLLLEIFHNNDMDLEEDFMEFVYYMEYIEEDLFGRKYYNKYIINIILSMNRSGI